MPIIQSAIKKVRKDKVRTIRNKKRAAILKTLVKNSRRESSDKNLQQVFSALDKAVKVNLIHKNKANRLKSRLSRRSPEESKTAPAKKTASKKSVASKKS